VTLYVDSSALAKRYLAEHDSDAAIQLLATDPVLATCRITEVEVRRALAHALDGDERVTKRQELARDLDAFALLAIDPLTCNEAARIAEQTMCKALDALHVASALRAGEGTTFLTFDVKQAAAAREVGLHVVGA
jgi:predicted nucleic acid-binding protein